MKASDIQLDDYKQAETEHRLTFERLKPPRPTPTTFTRNPMVWFLAFLGLGAGILSAFRTHDVFALVGDSNTEGWLAVWVVECAAASLALFGVIENYKRRDEVPDSVNVKVSVQAVIALAITTALLTNIYSIVIDQGDHYQSLDYAIIILAGSIAAVSLAIVGHTIGVMWVLAQEDIKEALADWRKICANIDDERRTEWSKVSVQKKWVRLVKNDQREQPVNSDVNSVHAQGVQTGQPASGAAFARLAYEQQQRQQATANTTVEHVIEHLPDLYNEHNLNVSEAAKMLGCSRNTIYKAARELGWKE